jgi:hypothetical protein
MGEIVVSLGLVMLMTVSQLRLMTDYLIMEKQDYAQTLATLQAMSAAQWPG